MLSFVLSKVFQSICSIHLATTKLIFVDSPRLNMPLEIYLSLEEPSTTRVHLMPLRMAQVVAKVSKRIQPDVTVPAGEVGHHVAREPVAGVECV